jgi:hypothetical protein
MSKIKDFFDNIWLQKSWNKEWKNCQQIKNLIKKKRDSYINRLFVIDGSTYSESFNNVEK